MGKSRLTAVGTAVSVLGMERACEAAGGTRCPGYCVSLCVPLGVSPSSSYLGGAASLVVKKACFKASDGVILLSGFSVKHRSSRSTKWFKSLDSTSFIPPEAAMRRVRRSRVGLTTARVRTVVCTSVSIHGLDDDFLF
ncbi:hypothetical protein GGS23DRAFT_269895 [Durotheca rogersii]|uniref:uncharacterized protein n=1 Tax=Durotheca rogersii TaxID=419775 RepID=UPI002220B9F3|nr:uncharacterized protein GGS23DRAFT_269895 [Durotheca rogersii]KAI5866421.1 hypothetical protein GGS23DRAFT_269895 [Durotheca rogersii]